MYGYVWGAGTLPLRAGLRAYRSVSLPKKRVRCTSGPTLSTLMYIQLSIQPVKPSEVQARVSG